MKAKWTLLLVALLVLAALGRENQRQELDLHHNIVLWSAQGPVAVKREGDVQAQSGPGYAERLLEDLLQGPTAQEASQGVRSAIPGGTGVAGVLQPSDQVVVVRFDMPPEALRDLTHESFEVIASQVGKTLLPMDWHELQIQVRDPATGVFVALADFLPEVDVPDKPSGGAEPETTFERAQAAAPGQAQPVGALTGKTVYVSAGHGWQWNTYTGRWRTQRPPYPSTSYDGPIIEDHNNAEAVNQYLLHYLWNAGAQVWPVRERDMNENEALVDDESPGYSGTGWTKVTRGYGGHSQEASTVTGAATATARWRADLASDGRYAVYVWFRSGADRAADVEYIIQHAGGETTVRVDQRRHGHTWYYIGTYGFLAGQPAQVTLTNQSAQSGRIVVADAVRFGGGTFDSLSGIEAVAPGAPDKPWWEVSSYYYTQKMGMKAPYGDITARPTYARWEHANTGDDAVYVSWHSNGYTGYAQWNVSGTETYVHNGEGLPRTEGSLELADAIHSEVVRDIRRGWDSAWVDRGRRQANLGELRLLWDDDASKRMPGALIEIGFHDHPGDTDALKEPRFNQLVARAIYQGIARYYDPHATLLPDPPTHLAVENVGGGQVRVSWNPPATDALDLGGHAATDYRVYTSSNGIGWSNGRSVGGATDCLLSGLASGELLFVRVTATNGGGESLPTETLAVRVGGGARMLVVNGFDRLDGGLGLYEDDAVEGLNVRMLLDRMNRYDYVIQHAEAIRRASNHALDSASNEAVESGGISLRGYAIVDWILGNENSATETLNSTEQALLRGYLDSGGSLFISGSGIAEDLDHRGSASDRDFFNRYLRASYAGQDVNTYSVQGTAAPFAGLSLRFDAPGMYEVNSPDRLLVSAGSDEAFRYVGGSGGLAGVQYTDDRQRVVTLGFPFETIRPNQRVQAMSAVLGFPADRPSLTVHRWLPLIVKGASKGPGEADPACPDAIANGGFEVDDAWTPNPENYPAYSAIRARTGLRSGIVGHDQVPYSSVRQPLSLPPGSSATLRVWLYPINQNGDTGDRQYIALWDQSGARHDLEWSNSNAQQWLRQEYDVSAFTGQTITVIVGATNDGDGNLTRMYIDDVELEVCP